MEGNKNEIMRHIQILSHHSDSIVGILLIQTYSYQVCQYELMRQEEYSESVGIIQDMAQPIQRLSLLLG